MCPSVILLPEISSFHVETTVQIFAHIGAEPYTSFKIWKTLLFLKILHPQADLLWQMPHPGEAKMKKFPKNARGDGGWVGLELTVPLSIPIQRIDGGVHVMVFRTGFPDGKGRGIFYLKC